MFELPPYVRSCVPSALVSGEPTSSPPLSVAQFTPSVSPIEAHVRGTMLDAATPSPLYDRYFPAILPVFPAEESNCDVSYHPCAVEVDASGLDSKLKNQNSLSFQNGPPRPPPYWLNRELSRFTPRDAARAASVVPVGA